MSIQSFNKLVSDLQIRASLITQEATGFYAVHCPICGENNRKTGGFKFESDQIIYNCFRGSCNANCVYTLGQPVSKKFRKLVDCYGVKIPADLNLIRSSVSKQLDSLDDDLYKEIVYKSFPPCDEMVPFAKSNHRSKPHWEEYFKSRKCSTDQVFMFESGQYKGMPAVGVYHYNKLIGVQVVTDGGAKYITLTPNENIIAAPAKNLNKGCVIVVEGILDMLCFPNTVATLKSTITPEQAYTLRGKEVILLPDRKSNNFFDIHKKYGWKMCIPSWEEKDLNAAVCKYGRFIVARKIRESTLDNTLDIEVRYKLWKENNNKK